MADLRVLSLGAGVQSTTMALMAAHGEIEPMPDFAIFADTGAEPAAVYEHLAWMESPNVLPFPVVTVSAGNIRDDTVTAAGGSSHARGGRAASAPFFTLGRDGRAAPLRRQCTSHYKVEPINRELRRRLGAAKGERLPKGASVDVWIGISTDEIVRVKPAREAWQHRRWPLIEARMSRHDCKRWLERHGYPEPPRSACTFCPYRSDVEWRALREASEDDWLDAVAIDTVIRGGFRRVNSEKTTGDLFVHRSLVPLGDVDLATAAERGQPDLFGEECEGMCGV